MSLGYIIYELAHIYSLIIVVYCILTWVPVRTSGVLSDIQAFFAKLSEPYLKIFRKYIPPIGGYMDISPIVALIVLQLGAQFLARIL